MNFKDLLEEDSAEIFCLDEFSEYMIIDGVILKAHLILSTDKKSGVESRNFIGLYGDFVTIYFKTSDYCKKRERIPRQGEFCYICDKKTNLIKRYEVITSEDDLGITRLFLDAYRQNMLRRGSAKIIGAGVEVD